MVIRAPQLSKAIAAGLTGPVSAVASPDHPYLLTGPDLLVAEHAALLAVFIERAAEALKPSRLIARQILSTLALPSHTRFVLIGRSGSSFEARNWDLVLESEDPAYIASALREVERMRNLTPRRTREAAFEGAAHILLQESTLEQQAESTNMFQEEERTNRYREAVDRRRSVEARQGHLVSDARTLPLSTATSRLVEAMNISVPVDFLLDTGAVYPVADRGIHRFWLDAPSEGRRTFDPFKLRRAAAFAGWALIGFPNEDSLFNDSGHNLEGYDDE